MTNFSDSNFSPNTGRAILSIAPAVLRGEIAAAKGDYDKAIALLEQGVRLEDALVYTEPTEWAFPVRHALGAVLLEAGRPAEAETVYWEDLKRNRENGWALTGLIRVYSGRNGEAEDEPFALEPGATVADLARAIHNELGEACRGARLWGPHSRFPGQEVGRAYELRDGDVVEVLAAR